MITAYDLYRYFEKALDFYMDSIALQEDPTENDRKNYEYIKYWRPSLPDKKVKNILKSIVINNNGDKANNES